MPNANPLLGKAPPPFNKDWACYHPITISSAMIDSKGQPASDFTLHIKSMGPGTWSQALVDKVAQMTKDGEAPSGLKVWLGGPNGKLAFNPRDCDKVVMCGGGIGVTPFLALAQELHTRALNGETVPEFELVWVERELSNFDAYDNELTYLTSKESPLTLRLYVTKQTGTQENGAKVHGVAVSAGRPEFVEILANAATFKGKGGADDLQGIQVVQGEKAVVVGVFSCGPPSMMKSVRTAVQGASNAKAKYYLHEETFEL
jgi:predicted ferric reductase